MGSVFLRGEQKLGLRDPASASLPMAFRIMRVARCLLGTQACTVQIGGYEGKLLKISAEVRERQTASRENETSWLLDESSVLSVF